MADTQWQIQDAEQRFGELIRCARIGGVQVVTEHGAEVAVVLGTDEFRRLTAVSTDLKEYLLAGPRAELTITPSGDRPREIDLSDA